MLMEHRFDVMDVHRGPYTVDAGLVGTLLCDIDGTVADLSHRRVYVASKPKNWKAFNASMDRDTPIEHVIGWVNTLYDYGWTVVMCSGRGSEKRDVTLNWLNQHGVKHHNLYMRAVGDYRKDSIVKSELLDRIYVDGYTPSLVFDDRNQVVDMWRERGLTCIQVAEGDF